jgi:flavin-dependent dehydrogenase
VFDVAIAGGGVAGSSLGYCLARRGLSVILFDRVRFPRAKPCGEGLLPQGVAALREMGLEPPPFPRIFGFRLVARDGKQVEGDFPEGHGLGVRRERFDAWLLGRAQEAGVEVREGESFPNACDARWIVAADGLHSRFVTGRPDRPRRIGFSTHVRGLDLGNRVEIRFKKEGEVYLTPGDDDTQVAVLGRAAVLKGSSGKDMIARFLGGAPDITAPVLGMGPLGRRVRALVSGNVVATGDAAGAPDPITGEGMSLALRSAIRLADAIARGDPRSYAAWRLAQGAAARTIGRRVLAIAPFANRVIERLGRRPDFLRRFMRVAAGLDEPEALPLRAWIGLLIP